MKTIAGPGVSNSFTYNGLDTRVGKVDSSGTSTYRRDGAGVTAPVLSDGSAVYTPGVSQRRAGATTFDLSDRLGTASRQTDVAKNTTATRTYDAFGMLVASTGTPKGPFGFAGGHGYQEDGDTGLKLLGHRYYDPSTGRFLTRDPVKDGRNWVAYCDNDPLGNVDPTGLIIRQHGLDTPQGRRTIKRVRSTRVGKRLWDKMDRSTTVYDIYDGGKGVGETHGHRIDFDPNHRIPLPKKGVGGTNIDSPPDNTLYHEMVHAYYGIGDPEDGENGPIITKENAYRKERGYPKRAVY